MINLTKKLVLGLILCLLSVGWTDVYCQSTGTTYYVSSSQGNDNNSGTSSDRAWRSLSKVERTSLQPGDRVLLRRGDTWGERLYLDNTKGNASARIVVGAYGSEGASRPVLNPVDPARVVKLENCFYVTIENLDIEVPQDKSGILIRGDAQYCTVRNCLVTSSKGNVGIVYSAYLKEVDARPTYSIVSNCEVSGFREGIVGSGGINKGGRIENNYVHSARTDVSGDLIRAHGSRERKGDYNGLVISGNKLTRWTDDAIDLYTGSGVIVEYNEIYRGEYPLFDNGNSNGSGNGIKLGGVTNSSAPAPTSSGNVARYNTIYDLSPRKKLPGNRNFLSNGIDTNGGIDSEIYGNLIYDVEGNAIVAGNGTEVYNNTCRADTKATLFVNGSNVRVYNNIFSSSIKEISVKVGATATGRNNLLENGSSDAAYNGTDDLNGNPRFVNPDANNYKLTAGSIAVDAGTSFGNYNQDREGNPIVGIVDIGSYELQGGVVAPPSGGITIRIAGASTTKNNDPNHPDLQGWGDELAPLMKDRVTVVNYADPGESTKSFIDRGFWATLVADIQSGDYVIIHFGHNDSKDDPEKATTPGTLPSYNGTYKANLKRMAQDVLDLGAIPIINSPVERARWSNNVLQNTHGNYVPAAQKAAQEKNVVYLNTWAASRAWMEAVGEQQMSTYFPRYRSRSPGNTDTSTRPVDFTHTNAAGALQNAEAFILQLQASSSLLKQYIKGGTPPSGPTDRWLEGECASTIGSDWQVVNDANASQGSFLQAKPGPFRRDAAPTQPAAQVVYNFSVSQAGDYQIFTRHRSVDGDDDSFWIRINGGPWQNAYLGENRGSWVWALLGGDATYALPTGNNTITLAFREPNARLDKLFLTLDGGSPSGLGPVASNACAAPPASDDAWLEAECATVASSGSFWSVVDNSNASGGSLLEANTAYSGPNSTGRDDPKRQIQFSFDVSQAGDYHLFARHTIPSGSGSSFLVKVNGGSWRLWQTTQSGSLAWQQVLNQTFALTAGQNTVTITNHRQDSQLDKVAISLDGSLPAGPGQPASNCGASSGTAVATYQLNITQSGVSSDRADWNDIGVNDINGSRTFNGLTDTEGSASDVALTVYRGSLGSNLNGVGDNKSSLTGGIYPDAVLRYAAYTSSGAFMTFSNLDPSLRYSVTVLGGRTGGSSSKITQYVVDGQTKSLQCFNNKSETQTFETVAPTATGEIKVTFREGGDTFGYLNAVVLEVISTNALRTAARGSKVFGEVKVATTNIQVYPNPSDHSTTLRFASPRQSQVGPIWLTDLSGKVVRRWEPPLTKAPNELRIDTHDIPAGWYLLREETNEFQPTKLLISH